MSKKVRWLMLSGLMVLSPLVNHQKYIVHLIIYEREDLNDY